MSSRRPSSKPGLWRRRRRRTGIQISQKVDYWRGFADGWEAARERESGGGAA